VKVNIHSSEETADLILKTLLTLVSSSSSACTALVEAEDWSPLIEIAPKQPLVLSIFTWSWINGKPENPVATRGKIDSTIAALIASYKGTDAVTFLDFVGKVLSRLNHYVSCTTNPQ
jgi:hypothetical protein